MRVWCLSVYVLVVLVITVTYLPGAHLRRSKKSSTTQRTTTHTDGEDNGERGDKRKREKQVLVDKNQVAKKQARKQNSVKLPDEENSDRSNSGTAKKLRGSKRQKKKEKKKNKSREKAERNSVHNGDIEEDVLSDLGTASDAEDSIQNLPSTAGDYGFEFLHNMFSSDEEDENNMKYMSDKLPCSDRLNRRLVKFYDKEIHISPKETEIARRVVDQFVKEMWPHIQTNLDGLHFKQIYLVGSMDEGLGAMTVSDFDFHLPLKIQSHRVQSVDIADVTGYKHIICEKCGALSEIVNGMEVLSPRGVIRKLQSIVQSVLNAGTVPLVQGCVRYRPGYKGPTVSVELDCEWNHEEHILRVEFVPLVTDQQGKQFVPKKADFGILQHYPQSWRESYSHLERSFIKEKHPEDLSVLRLAKGIVHHKDRSLNYLTSYHLKNVFCHMHKGGYRWQSKRLCDQLRDFLKLLYTFAKARSLPNCFDKDVNLFMSFPRTDTLSNLEHRLQNILNSYENKVRNWIGETEEKDEL